MEAPALRQPRPLYWRRALLVLAVVIVLGLITVVAASFFWLRDYQPLGQGNMYGSNPGDGVMVQPPDGSGGTNVFFPRYRANGTFRVLAGVANVGRFTVTVLGPPKPDPQGVNPYRLIAAEVAPLARPGYHGSPLDAAHPIRLQPGAQRDVIFVFRFVSRCIGGQPPRYWTQSALGHADVGFRTVGLRVKYAREFEKTQNLTLPFAITLICKNGVTAPRG